MIGGGAALRWPGQDPKTLAACDWRKPGCSAINVPKLAFSHHVLWRRAGRTAALEIDQWDNACVGCVSLSAASRPAIVDAAASRRLAATRS